MTVKHVWAQGQGWNNLALTDEITALVMPLVMAKFGKQAEGARFSINKRGGDIVIGVADAELERLRKAADKTNRKAGDAAQPAVSEALAEMSALKAQVAALMDALAAKPKPGRGKAAKTEAAA